MNNGKSRKLRRKWRSRFTTLFFFFQCDSPGIFCLWFASLLTTKALIYKRQVYPKQHDCFYRHPTPDRTKIFLYEQPTSAIKIWKPNVTNSKLEDVLKFNVFIVRCCLKIYQVSRPTCKNVSFKLKTREWDMVLSESIQNEFPFRVNVLYMYDVTDECSLLILEELEKLPTLKIHVYTKA